MGASNAITTQLSDALDAITASALSETLEFLEKESDGFRKNCSIALSGKAMYALSRPRVLWEFERMIADRLLQRYPKQKKRALERAERERPRLKIIRGPVNLLAFKIGGTQEEITQEIESAPKRIPGVTKLGTSGDVPF